MIEELRLVTERKFPAKRKFLDRFFMELPFELVYTPKELDLNEFPEMRDVKDSPILATAIMEGIDVFLTGDKDFLALAFSQMFNLLCERADNVHSGRLPHHVRVLWDEAANTGQVPQLEKLVAVIRSREVSLCLLYQQLAQCKAIYDKHAETILGNMAVSYTHLYIVVSPLLSEAFYCFFLSLYL